MKLKYLEEVEVKEVVSILSKGVISKIGIGNYSCYCTVRDESDEQYVLSNLDGGYLLTAVEYKFFVKSNVNEKFSEGMKKKVLFSSRENELLCQIKKEQEKRREADTKLYNEKRTLDPNTVDLWYGEYRRLVAMERWGLNKEVLGEIGSCWGKEIVRCVLCHRGRSVMDMTYEEWLTSYDPSRVPLRGIDITAKDSKEWSRRVKELRMIGCRGLADVIHRRIVDVSCNLGGARYLAYMEIV
jgi:hypothetical protein